jgi:Domain of unknown function (DUF4406)
VNTLRVYVASPMTLQPIEGPRAAARAGDLIVNAGHFVYLPQLDRLWAYMTGEKSYDFWIRHDEGWLEVCDAVVRLPGESKGADGEIRFAAARSIPIFIGVESFLNAENFHESKHSQFNELESLEWQPHVGQGCIVCGDVKWT